MAIQRDRLLAILDPANTTLNGIDFVGVASADQRTLHVHFLTTLGLAGTVTAAIIDGGETISVIPVLPIDDTTDWTVDSAARPVLTLRVPIAGDFSTYRLSLTSSSLDGFFASSAFTFKANCPSDFDCRMPPADCPPLEGDLPPIDYLAKDFASFRRALSDFSTLAYPEWQERSEADFGMMFLEALSGLADDLSYTQDRGAAEATLETATQRSSMVRHSRLVDYEPRPATSARVILQCNVQAGPIPAGLAVSAQAADGSRVPFETGTGLADESSYRASAAWNGARDGSGGIQPYVWDDSQLCLPAGSTEMWVLGHGFAFYEGQELLIDTAAATTADAPDREIVRLVASLPGAGDQAVEDVDPLFPPGGPPTPVTRIRWRPEDALKVDHDLTRTTLAGNLVSATQGRRHTESFAIRSVPPGVSAPPLAVERTGPNSAWDDPTPLFLYTLKAGRLAFLGSPDDPEAAPIPEITLSQPASPTQPVPIGWTWRRSLLESERFERAYTVDPAALRAIATNRLGLTAYDYDGDDAETIRFGDGTFGLIPVDGAWFEVTYRDGVGAAGNVPAGALNRVDAATPPAGLSITNPFAAAGGDYAERDETVRRVAPYAFRASQFRAVTQTDYEDAAQTLPWVQRAGTTFRWTGSWLTVFTAADPRGTEVLATAPHTELIRLLNRYRLAGYESYVPRPSFVSLDLIITVCARPDAFRGDVEAAVLAVLSSGRDADGRTGFFHPDRLTFGTTLERSALEAAIQAAQGVAGVLLLRVRRRGVSGYRPMPDTITVGADQVLRVDNDPSRPEAGSLRVIVEGGK